MAEFDLRCRMSRKGDCLDHAVTERFFGSLKGDRTSLRHDASRQEAWDDQQFPESDTTQSSPRPPDGFFVNLHATIRRAWEHVGV
jgi:transposase InsO family protein